jgi:hypothetical protein
MRTILNKEKRAGPTRARPVPLSAETATESNGSGASSRKAASSASGSGKRSDLFARSSVGRRARKGSRAAASLSSSPALAAGRSSSRGTSVSFFSSRRFSIASSWSTQPGSERSTTSATASALWSVPGIHGSM